MHIVATQLALSGQHRLERESNRMVVVQEGASFAATLSNRQQQRLDQIATERRIDTDQDKPPSADELMTWAL